jgi:flagellar basal-body rod protein FlgB
LGRGGESPTPTLAVDTHTRSLRPDGNNVEIEKELLDMNKNSVDHEFLSQVITYNIKQLKMAITGHSL